MKKFEELLNYFLRKKEKISDWIISSIPILVVVIIILVFLKVFKIPLIQQVYNNSWTTISTITWETIYSWVENVIVEQSSWSIETWEVILTWETIPTDPRWYIDYVLKKWTAWKDFFIINPAPQPVIHGETSAENNDILFPYVYKYRYRVSLSKNDWWYIMITLNKNLQKDRKVFLAINWASKWALDKNLSKAVYDEKEFLYDMKDVPAWWYHINLFDYVKNQYLEIWGFVGEVWNWIQKITIVLK